MPQEPREASMSAHQPAPSPDGRESTPIAAAGRDARETPTMNELLAACAAASAVSTPPDAAEEARRGRPADEPEAEEESEPGTASTGGRDAA
ncbi:hypothetical protein [Streptomyces sp. Isolate_219]|uniref:hypothetical protein n=1 Tax=Streptomyces sp. Isolate_219 TaxID=2950110 RepID=UPI0021C6385D|nr:hypothetical protein [Streptomyces sp. Isolate_219]MCR8575044.1 hypothetical protein [Streptomyces sp. Isolate_219]